MTGSRWWGLCWTLAGALALAAAAPGGVAAPGVALAQSSPEVSLRADTDDVEMGEAITVSLTAMSDASTPQPGDPQLKAPRGWVVTGPMISTQTQMSIVNGRVSQKAGFRATWQVVPTTVGSTELGPASFSLSGKRQPAGSLRVNVRQPSPGGAKPRPNRRRNDPFGGLFGPLWGLDDDPPQRAPETPPPTSQLSLDAAVEPQAFMRAVVDKNKVAVGEQVTLSLYLYAVPRSYQVVDPHEPSAPDFFQRTVSNGDTEAHPVNVGGSRWIVQLVRKIALFPLKAGDLAIGPMTITMLGQGFRGSGIRGGLVRASQPVVVQATEPPAGPRPAGYMLGDVGSFNLQAQVEPRKVEAGGSVAVTAILRGTGNPPSSLRIPERKGVTWLEPEQREVIDTGEGTVGGSRTFTYIVKLGEQGSVDLGELSVPYWNPKLHEYQVARARLGSVEVTRPTSAPAPSGSALAITITPPAASAGDPFAAVGPARKAPGAYTPPGNALADRPWFWLALVGSPSLVLLAQASSGALSGLRRRRHERDAAASTRARKALDDALAAEARGDRRAAASAVERALVVAVEGATSIKIRALLSHEVQPALEAAGLPSDRVAAVVELLAVCEHERFQPGEKEASEPLSARAKPLIEALSR